MSWYTDPRKISQVEKLEKCLLLTSRCLGLFPRDNKFDVSKYWTLYSIILRTFLASTTPYFITEILRSWENGYFVKLRIALTVHSELTGMISSAVHLLALLRNNHFWKHLWFISRDKSQYRYPRLMNILFFALMINTGFFKVVDMYHYPIPSAGGSLLHMFSSWISDISLLVIILQFCLIIDRIKSRVILMDRKLINSKLPTPSLLKQSIDLHVAFIRFAKETNQVFSIQILTSSITLFIKFVSYLYDTVADLLQKGLDAQMVVSRVSAALHFKLLMYFLVKTCQDFRDAADSFNYDIFAKLRKSHFTSDVSEIRTYVLMRNTIQFTAAGFFDLDYPIITSVTTMAATFLVVVLQFNVGVIKASDALYYNCSEPILSMILNNSRT